MKLYLLGLEESDGIVWLLTVNDLRLPEVLTVAVNFLEKAELVEFLNDSSLGAAAVAVVVCDSFKDEVIDCGEAEVAAIEAKDYVCFFLM